jgi:hypothetical protein
MMNSTRLKLVYLQQHGHVSIRTVPEDFADV